MASSHDDKDFEVESDLLAWILSMETHPDPGRMRESCDDRRDEDVLLVWNMKEVLQSD